MYDPVGATRSPKFSIPTQMKPWVPRDLSFSKSLGRAATGTVAAHEPDVDGLATLADMAAE
jgi:hypothetical protein